jgi:8-oxo-dGTP pyrophosphatase MutT (NUDIX family)
MEVKYSVRKVKMAVCMAIFDSDNEILLTRRAARMKIFPKAWVMPGGHLDPDESLEEGVIREIVEETGVKIETLTDDFGANRYYHNGKECILEPFYAFESASFKVVDVEPPNSGHLIMFFRIKLNCKSEEITL